MKLYLFILNIISYGLGRLGLGAAYNFQCMMVAKNKNYCIVLTRKEQQLVNQVLEECQIDFTKMAEDCHIVNRAEETVRNIKAQFKITGYELSVLREKYPELAAEVTKACDSIDAINESFSNLNILVQYGFKEDKSLNKSEIIKINSGCGKIHGFLDRYLKEPYQTEIGKYAHEKANLPMLSYQISWERNQNFDSFFFFVTITNELAYSAFRYYLGQSEWPKTTEELIKYETTKGEGGTGHLELFDKLQLKEISPSQIGIEYDCSNNSESYQGYTRGKMLLKADVKEDTFEICIPNRITNDVEETNFRMVVGSNEFIELDH